MFYVSIMLNSNEILNAICVVSLTDYIIHTRTNDNTHLCTCIHANFDMDVPDNLVFFVNGEKVRCIFIMITCTFFWIKETCRDRLNEPRLEETGFLERLL